MYRSGIFVLMLCHLSGAVPVPVDTVIIQVQQWGVVGDQRVVKQVLLNGVTFTGTSEEVSSIIQTMSADALRSTLMSLNQIAVMRNHTIVRSRECILEGSQLHWTDRVFYDGEVYLTLDQSGTWTAHLTQALALKALWDEAEQYIKTDRLQEGCIQLMRELRLSGDQSAPGLHLPQYMIPVLALLAFVGLIIISLLLYKKQGMQHPGGVIGSVIHYPTDMAENPPEKKGDGYQAL